MSGTQHQAEVHLRVDQHFDYDDHGNLIRIRHGKGQQLEQRLSYNAQHQLMRIEHYRNGQRQKRLDFRYDAFGRRIDKTHYSLKEHSGQAEDQRSHSEAYLWQGDTLIQVRQLDRLSFLKSHRIYLYEPGSHRPLALWDDALGLHHLDTDHAGTPKAMYSDETGEEVWRTDHETYGKTRDTEAKLTHPVTGQAFEPHLRFQGQYEDIETGLYQNRYRYYDPQVGRYISQDPIGLLGGLNAYRYCPNPVGYVDPLGLESKECAKAYSTLYETQLSVESYPGVSRQRHFQEANESLIRRMESDSSFAQMMEALGVHLPRTSTGLAPRKPPQGFTWHHEQEPGIMRLVPREQHTPGSSYWNVLHPDGRGGYAIWGKP